MYITANQKRKVLKHGLALQYRDEHFRNNNELVSAHHGTYIWSEE